MVVRRVQRPRGGAVMTGGCIVCTFRDRLGRTLTETRILAALFEADPRRIVTKRELEAAIGYAPSTRTQTTTQHVYRLRLAYGVDAIECVKHQGYRLSPAMRQRCEDALHDPRPTDRSRGAGAPQISPA